MTTDIKPHIVKASELDPDWHLIDASGKKLGRLCTEIARVLQGKHKPSYTPYLKTGDFVIVVNASKIYVSQQKQEKKIYYRHTSYPGGLRKVTLKELLNKNPSIVIEKAIKGMLPKNRLGRQLLSRLKVYNTANHPHQSQLLEKAALQKKKTRLVADDKETTITKGKSINKTSKVSDKPNEQLKASKPKSVLLKSATKTKTPKKSAVAKKEPPEGKSTIKKAKPVKQSKKMDGK